MFRVDNVSRFDTLPLELVTMIICFACGENQKLWLRRRKVSCFWNQSFFHHLRTLTLYNHLEYSKQEAFVKKFTRLRILRYMSAILHPPLPYTAHQLHLRFSLFQDVDRLAQYSHLDFTFVSKFNQCPHKLYSAMSQTKTTRHLTFRGKDGWCENCLRECANLTFLEEFHLFEATDLAEVIKALAMLPALKKLTVVRAKDDKGTTMEWNHLLTTKFRALEELTLDKRVDLKTITNERGLIIQTV
jgi:hypothetical protein